MKNRNARLYFSTMLAVLLYVFAPTAVLAGSSHGKSSNAGSDKTYQAGLAAYKKQDYNTAQSLWMKAAKAGNSDAQYYLGHLYMNGLGVRMDYAAARYWFEQAAGANHPMAQNDLGSLYMNGQGVKRNLKEALGWYEKSANQGTVVAKYNCGLIYFIHRQFEKAAVFFKAASMAGYSKANYYLTRTKANLKSIPTMPIALVTGRPAHDKK